MELAATRNATREEGPRRRVLRGVAAGALAVALISCGEAAPPEEPEGAANVESAARGPAAMLGEAPTPEPGGQAPSLRIPPRIPEERPPEAASRQAVVTEARIEQIEEIPFREEGPRAIQLLKPWLDHNDVDVREAAIYSLASVEEPEADRILAEHARKEPDPILRTDIIDELLDREAEEALDTMLFLLADPDPEVREYAAEGLDELQDPRAAGALRTALRTEGEPYVRDAMEFALEGLEEYALDEDLDEE